MRKRSGCAARPISYGSNVMMAAPENPAETAAESAAAVGQVINIANGERVTINEVLATLKSLTGRMDVQAEYAAPRAGDVRDSLADLSLARSLLEYDPQVDLEEGLRLTIDWWTRSRFNGSFSSAQT